MRTAMFKEHRVLNADAAPRYRIGERIVTDSAATAAAGEDVCHYGLIAEVTGTVS